MTSEAIEKIKDGTGKSYDDISDALNRLINDDGQENIALSKRIELVIDDMLSDGYTAFDGTEVPPNESYIAEKSKIEKGVQGIKEELQHTPLLTDKCKLIATKHTATGDDIWVVTLKEKLSADDYKTLNSRVKSVGGYYSRFAKTPDGKAIPGFVFKSEPTEKAISVFNDFFNETTADDTRSKVMAENEKNIEKTQTKTEETLKKEPESDTIKKNEIEVKEIGIVKNGKVFEDSNIVDKSKTEVATGEVLQEGDSLHNSGRRLSQTDESGYRVFEKRTIQEVTELDKFKKISKDVVNELSSKKHKEIYQIYENDTRWNAGYEFDEMVTYDMLSNADNELRELFADNIAEYFNSDTDVTSDSTGKKVSADILKATKNSVVKNKNGQLIPVYHGTDADFDVFNRSDIGIHFGSYSQAVQRVTDKGIKEPKYKKAYLNIESPLIIDEDFYGWNAFQIAQKLNNMKLLTKDEALKYVRDNKTDVKKANSELTESLKSKGFDGIVYNNEIEAVNGKSYIVFDNEQIFTEKRLQEREDTENVHTGLLERESGNDTGVRKSELVSEAEEKRNIGTESGKSGENVVNEGGKHLQASETKTSAEEQHNGGNIDNGIRKSDNSDGNSGAGIGGNDNVDVKESVPKAKDFVITKSVAEEINLSAPSISDNINAVETLYALEKSGKAPTKAQQTVLAKFKGWGGLSGAFYGENKTKLQKVMSETELKAAQSTVNDAYFTPTNIIDGVYKALEHLGFEGGNVLEPSMGIGNFFGRMPKTVKENSSLFGVEIDTISGRIARRLYPNANIEIAPFQDVTYKDGAFDLIIGNVPFSEVKYKYKGKNYLIHDYFFVKAMDKLNDGGVLAFLTTKGTLDKLDSTAKG